MTLLFKQHGVATELRRESIILGWVVPMGDHWRWEVNPTAWKVPDHQVITPPRGMAKDKQTAIQWISSLFP